MSHNHKQAGFTLIELMIVIAIIGILAGIGIAQYQRYISRAQVADAVQVMRNARLVIEENLNRGEDFPNTTQFADYGVTTTSSVHIVTLTSDQENRLITAQFRPEDVAFQLASKKLAWNLTPEGWKCNRDVTDIPQTLLPADCK